MLESDIKACFDRIDHTALMGQVRRRVNDKRVLALVKAFLKAGIMTRDGQLIGSKTGTPQGGLCAAAHNPPYEQCWVMCSAGAPALVGVVALHSHCS